jgi:hypothetical protein
MRPFDCLLLGADSAVNIVTPEIPAKKWDAALSKQVAFVRAGHKRCVDPRARFSAAFELIQQCFEKEGFELDPDSKEFAAVKRAVEVILHYVFVSNRLTLWEKVEMPPECPAEAEILSGSIVWREIVATRKEFLEENICQDQIVDAMDLASRAILSMAAQLTWGLIEPEPFVYEAERHPAGDGPQARLMCAAYLPALADLVRTIWQPLRKQIRRKKKGGT